ncbi:Precursor of CEP9 [Melia azedarach]|uniref:Precursor of CEP9 n=1 Tax=Melia azedarach TaxID=155640 RepID=A0ACC1XUS0_MELAZ|nr:Precursor of CEP9 [Melia azedarach]
MAKIQSINKCVILLSLVIACYAILSTEGRQLKQTNKKEATAAKASSTEGKKKILPPIGYDDSTTAFKDDFRPTTPGNSPGVGHSFAQEEADVESNVVADHSVSTAGHSVTGFKDDFRPTAPGHSPGVGHAFQTENAGPKA